METLKDMEFWIGDVKTSVPLIDPKNFRQSAIEDIKRFEETKETGLIKKAEAFIGDKKVDVTEETKEMIRNRAEGMIEYIKQKFNVTDEDLKGDNR